MRKTTVTLVDGTTQRSRYELAERHIEVEIGTMMAYRIAYMQEHGVVANHEASMSKLFGLRSWVSGSPRPAWICSGCAAQRLVRRPLRPLSRVG